MINMEPVIAPLMSQVRLGLCDLIRVVREDIVYSSTMNIHVFTQVLHADAGALDMPSRISDAPRAIPLERLILKL